MRLCDRELVRAWEKGMVSQGMLDQKVIDQRGVYQGVRQSGWLTIASFFLVFAMMAFCHVAARAAASDTGSSTDIAYVAADPAGVDVVAQEVATAAGAVVDSADMAIGDGTLPGEEDIPVVLTATHLRQSLLDTPASVSIIDHDTIRMLGVRDIPDLFRLVPGMMVGYEQGNRATVSYHGTNIENFRRMQVMVDGRSVYESVLSRVDWLDLPLAIEDIERIEVTRGPNSAAYGANSYLAVINIITRHPQDMQGGLLRVRNGAVETEDYLLRQAGQHKDLSWRVTAGSKSDTGYDHDHQGKDYPDDRDLKYASARGEWRMSDVSSLDFQAGGAQTLNGKRYNEKESWVAPSHWDISKSYLSLKWNTEFSENHQMSVQGYYQRSHRVEDDLYACINPVLVTSTELKQLYAMDATLTNKLLAAASDGDMGTVFGLLAGKPTETALFSAALGQYQAYIGAGLGNTCYQTNQDFEEERSNLEMQHSIRMNEDLRGVVGLEFRQDRAYSSTYLAGEVDNHMARAFAHAEYRMAAQWLLNVGGSYEHVHTDGNLFSPRLAVNWLFADDHVLRGIITRAYHTGDLFEEQGYTRYYARDIDASHNKAYDGYYFQTSRTDAEIKPESILSREISYVGHFPQQQLLLDIKVFNDALEVNESDFRVSTFDIGGLAPLRLRGMEGQLTWEASPTRRFWTTYAYVRNETDLKTDKRFTARNSGSLTWMERFADGFSFSSSYIITDKYDDHFLFRRLDLNLAREWAVGKGRLLEVAARWQRLLAEKQELREENLTDGIDKAWVTMDLRW